MQKTLQSREQYYIEFTDEELVDLNLEKGEPLEFIIKDDGVLLQKLEKLDLELSEFPREILERLIKESCDKNVSVNEIISEALKNFVDSFDADTFDPSLFHGEKKCCGGGCHNGNTCDTEED
jgi:bifunctional DNA-binding transcriptional regulator/antitoxin component of YhaV-PrlF toxin-antitoxin module